jgi:hypothetical protein
MPTKMKYFHNKTTRLGLSLSFSHAGTVGVLTAIFTTGLREVTFVFLSFFSSDFFFFFFSTGRGLEREGSVERGNDWASAEAALSARTKEMREV